MSEVKVVRIPEGDSGLDRRNIEGTDREEEFISLVVSGINDPEEIARRMKMTLRTVERSLRTDSLLGQIKRAIQARALTMIPKNLERAYGDSEDKRSRVRAQAREYIRKIAEGDSQMIQQNNQITSWDPSYDERLFEKGRQMFETLAQVTAEATVEKMLDEED